MFRQSWLALIVLAGLMPASAGAQVGYTRPATNPLGRPTVSPYLNLLRPGNTAVNYYDLVRPQVDLTNSVQRLQQQTTANAAAITAAQDVLPETGHKVQFLNLSHYYMNRQGSPGGGTAQGTSPVRPPSPTGNLGGTVRR
jgi:hypothetical protein